MKFKVKAYPHHPWIWYNQQIGDYDGPLNGVIRYLHTLHWQRSISYFILFQDTPSHILLGPLTMDYWRIKWFEMSSPLLTETPVVLLKINRDYENGNILTFFTVLETDVWQTI